MDSLRAVIWEAYRWDLNGVLSRRGHLNKRTNNTEMIRTTKAVILVAAMASIKNCQVQILMVSMVYNFVNSKTGTRRATAASN